ncbi:MAG: hypothetical protein M4579_006131 [Chaenotheca gracillima]|nr:MAG: hypothetical protein M4579_006131 [Chaenotheca gracillima]
MNRSIEQTLASLIPTFNGPIPPELLELATSLLAQSRSRASNLKSEEEIARPYACAQIACERLRQSLRLPKITAHPPCPPRVYNKFYRYLEGVLVAQKPKRDPVDLPSTPSKTSQLARKQNIPNKSLTPRSGAGPSRNRAPAPPASVPPWTSTAVHCVTSALGAPAAAEPVFEGFSIILNSSAPPFLANTDTVAPTPKKDKLPALLIALTFFAVTRLSGQQTTGADYVKMKDKALEATIDFGRKEQRADWEDVSTEEVDAWMKELFERGWLRLAWFEGIKEGSGLGDAADMPLSEDEPSTGSARHARQIQTDGRSKRSKSTGANTLQRGLGTMVRIPPSS